MIFKEGKGPVFRLVTLMTSVMVALVVSSYPYYQAAYSQVSSTPVTIDGFDVTQKTIPASVSAVDFQLLISQQDQSLSCPSGHLDWIVFYSAAPGGSTYLVRDYASDSRKNTNLPLSPNPLYLNFRESNFVSQSSVAANQGYLYFRAALGCNLNIGSVYNSALALSAPVCVTITGGSGNCTTATGPPSGVTINNFDIQPRNINPGNSPQFTLLVTINKATYDSYCTSLIGGGIIGSDLYWVIYEKLPGGSIEQFEPIAMNKANNVVAYNLLPFNNGQARIDLSFSKIVDERLNSSGTPLNNRNFYAYLSCNRLTGAAELATSSIVSLSVGSGGTVDPGSDVNFKWGIWNPLVGNDPGQNVFGLVFVVTDWILNIAGSLMIILIIYSGVRFLISRGNPGEITQAKNILRWALVGFAVILIGKGFVFLVDSVLRGGVPLP